MTKVLTHAALTPTPQHPKFAATQGNHMLDQLTRTQKYGVLALAILLAGCSRPSDSADVADQVRKNALGVVAAYNAQDPHAAAAYDAPDYVGVFHGTPNTLGPAADEAAMKAGMAAAKVDWKLGPDKVTVARSGDLAVFEAPYTFVVTMQQGVNRETGTWIAIFKRQDDGSMKLWRSIASDTPAAAPAPGTQP
jgi:ketosteroid isomerase-like protein